MLRVPGVWHLVGHIPVSSNYALHLGHHDLELGVVHAPFHAAHISAQLVCDPPHDEDLLCDHVDVLLDHHILLPRLPDICCYVPHPVAHAGHGVLDFLHLLQHLCLLVHILVLTLVHVVQAHVVVLLLLVLLFLVVLVVLVLLVLLLLCSTVDVLYDPILCKECNLPEDHIPDLASLWHAVVEEPKGEHDLHYVSQGLLAEVVDVLDVQCLDPVRVDRVACIPVDHPVDVPIWAHWDHCEVGERFLALQDLHGLVLHHPDCSPVGEFLPDLPLVLEVLCQPCDHVHGVQASPDLHELLPALLLHLVLEVHHQLVDLLHDLLVSLCHL